MKKKLLISIATILLVFIIGIVHITTEQIAFWEALFGTEYTPVFKEQELKVPTDGLAAAELIQLLHGPLRQRIGRSADR